MNEQDVLNMRKAMGTLPSQSPKKTYSYKNDVESMYVKMTDWPRNPYEAIGRAVCATWGDNETGSTGKWEKLTPENRYRVVLSALTGNTLQQALENLNFQFEVNGISRSDFDQHARARIGFNFESIGTRDNCVLPGTLVKTSVGLKKIEDISLDDYVLTHKKKYEKVLNLFNRKYNGDVYNFKFFGHFDTISLTEEHPVFVIKRKNLKNKKTGRLQYNITNAEWILAKDIEKGDCVIEAIEKFNSEKIFFDLSNYYEPVYIGNQTGKTKKIHHVDIGEKLNKIEFDKNWAILIGWYLAEGCLNYRHTKNGEKIDPTGITFCLGKNDYDRGYAKELFDAIKNICPSINIKNTVKKIQPTKLPNGKMCENPQPAYHLKFQHRQIAKFIKENFGEYCYFKKVPEWFFKLDSKIKFSMLEAFCKGDGVYKDGKIIGMGATNESMIRSFHRLADSIDLNYSIYKQASSTSTAPLSNCEKGNKIIINDGYRFRLIKTITKNNYEGEVYNFEVNNDNSYTLSCVTVHNCKLDSDFLLYNEVIDQCEKDSEYKKRVENWVKLTKDLYEETINLSDSSWQTGRCFLPQSVNHSYVFGCNYLALKGQMSRRLAFCEQEGIVALHWKIRKEVEDKFPLLASFFVPFCDKIKKCGYMEGPEGMTKYFSNLFDGCGRWEVINKDNSVYKEFNHSCTNSERLKQQGIPVLEKNEIITYHENDFLKLDPKDLKYFM